MDSAVNFDQKFALSEDREELLKSLVSGTSDWEYYSALQCLLSGDFKGFEEFERRYSFSSSRSDILSHRKHFMKLKEGDVSSIESAFYVLENNFGFLFDERRRLVEEQPTAKSLPTEVGDLQLPHKLIGEAYYLSNLHPRSYPYKYFDWKNRDSSDRRELLQKLPFLCMDDILEYFLSLEEPYGPLPSASFSNELYKKLTLSQLDELAKRSHNFLFSSYFIESYMNKLVPVDFIDYSANLEHLEEFHKRTLKFAEILPLPAQASMKGLLLFNALLFESERGIFNFGLFKEFLSLPLNRPKLTVERISSDETKYSLTYRKYCNGLIVELSDQACEKLIEVFLEEYFKSNDVVDVEEYRNLIDYHYLQDLLRQTKVLHIPQGKKEAEFWKSKYSPGELKNISDTSILEFSNTGKKLYYETSDKEYDVILNIKNIPTVTVKVFAINTFAYYKSKNEEISSKIELVGLVPSVERVYDYSKISPIHLHRERISIPMKSKRAVYVLEFIGGGLNCRTIIYKGGFRILTRNSVAGNVITVIDEENKPVSKQIEIHYAGKVYTTSDSKRKKPGILIPYGWPKSTKLIVRETSEGFASFLPFKNVEEDYSLNCAFHLDREQLLKKERCTVIARPTLFLSTSKVTRKLLKDVEMIVTLQTELEGTGQESSTREEVSRFSIPDEEIDDDRDIVKSFKVKTSEIVSVQVDFRAKVEYKFRDDLGYQKDLSRGEQLYYKENKMDLSPNNAPVASLFLLQIDGNYIIRCIGLGGETRPNVPIIVTLSKNVFTTEGTSVSVMTDEDGDVNLGPLHYVSQVRAYVDGAHNINLEGNIPRRVKRQIPKEFIANEGGEIQIPIDWNPELLLQKESLLSGSQDEFNAFCKELNENRFAIYEIRNNVVVREVSCEFKISCHPSVDRFVTFSIPKGTEGKFEVIDRVLMEKSASIFVLRNARQFKETHLIARDAIGFADNSVVLSDAKLLQITHVSADRNQGISIEVSGCSSSDKTTRAHAVLSHFVEPRTIWSLSKQIVGSAKVDTLPRERTKFLSGGKIDGEHQYIIDRKSQEKNVGVNLPNTTLLLNPNFVDTSTTAAQEVTSGLGLHDERSGPSIVHRKCFGSSNDGIIENPVSYQTAPAGGLAILPGPSKILGNLEIGSDGIIKIPPEEISPHHNFVSILVENKTMNAYEQLSLPESDVEVDYRDTTFKTPLDPASHFRPHYESKVLQKGEDFVMENAATAVFKVYDTLPKAFALLRTVSGNATVDSFEFVLKWHEMNYEEKIEKYSEFESHELNFFLFMKDREFFKTVGLPFLNNKKEKRIVDHFFEAFFDESSKLRSAFLEKYADDYGQFMRLNVAEQILVGWIQILHSKFSPILKHFVERAAGSLPASSFSSPKLRFAFEAALRGTELEGDGQDEMDAKIERLQEVAEMKAKEEVKERQFVRGHTRGRAKKEKKSSRDSMLSRKKKMMKKMKEEEFEEEDEMEEEIDFDEDDDEFDLASREQMTPDQLFRPMDATKVYAETDYYGMKESNDTVTVNLVTFNRLWADFAEYLLDQQDESKTKPFLSSSFEQSHATSTEVLFCIAVLDFPAESGEYYDVSMEHNGYTLTVDALSPIVIYLKGISSCVEAAMTSITEQINVLEKSFDPLDRQRVLTSQEANILDFGDSQSTRVEKFVEEEWLSKKVYGMKATLSNYSSFRLKMEMLFQIPMGSVPIAGTKESTLHPVEVSPFSSMSVEYFFYFPYAGDFEHFPSHISIKDSLLAYAEPARVFKVVDKLTVFDTKSWEYISQRASLEELIKFLEEENVWKYDVRDLGWRMRDKNQYEAIITVLSERLRLDPVLWKYALFNHDANRTRQVSSGIIPVDNIASVLGPFMNSTLICIDDIEAGHFRHLEFLPLVNERAHPLRGASQQGMKIANDKLERQFKEFCRILCFKAKLSQSDLLAAAYYLLLLDQTAEAARIFKRIKNPHSQEPESSSSIEDSKSKQKGKKGKKSTKSRSKLEKETTKEESLDAVLSTGEETNCVLQYDYMACYLEFCKDEPDFEFASKIATKYADYPNIRWRKLFNEVILQIREIEGNLTDEKPESRKGEITDADRARKQEEFAERQTLLEMRLINDQIEIEFKNVSKCVMKIYFMDLELLFSRNPFINVSGKNDFFSIVEPNSQTEIKLPSQKDMVVVPIPKAEASKNCYVEICAGPLSRGAVYFPNKMAVEVMHSFGQVKVTRRDTGRPISKVYVKVFYKRSGNISKFYKDGYTDHRGRFDYVSLNYDIIKEVVEFSILLQSDEFGSVIKNCPPPNN